MILVKTRSPNPQTPAPARRWVASPCSLIPNAIILPIHAQTKELKTFLKMEKPNSFQPCNTEIIRKSLLLPGELGWEDSWVPYLWGRGVTGSSEAQADRVGPHLLTQ